MDSDIGFRFLAVCEHAELTDAGDVNLNKVLVDVVRPASWFPNDLKVTAVASVVLTPDMKGKRLDLMAFALGKDGAPQKIAGYAGTPLILPEGTGPACLPYQISVPIPNPGIYGFYLFDREGCFGKKERLLATFLYGVIGR